MSEYDEFGDPPGQRPSIPRDGFGRPVLPHPETGEEVHWTRPTTLAKALSDTYNLNIWSKRMALRGLVVRPDLLSRVQATIPADPLDHSADKELNELIRKAEEAGGSTVGANIGTARHEFSRRVDADADPRSAVLALVPAEHQPYLLAYVDAMEKAQLYTYADMIEVMCCTPEVECAGTFDRLLIHQPEHGGMPMIGDLKTAKLNSLAYAFMEIAIQLSVYAHSGWWWDLTARQWRPHAEPIDSHVGVVMHLPNDLPPEDARCDLYMIDLKEGWELAQLAYHVRGKRRNTGRLARPWPVAEKVLELPDWETRLRAACSRADLSAVWREAAAAGQWTPELEVVGRARLLEIGA
jgi:hypothetical protein